MNVVRSASNYANDTLLLGMSDLTRLSRERPLVLTGGRGVFVKDEHGREYIEAVSSFYCVARKFGVYRPWPQSTVTSAFGSSDPADNTPRGR